MTVAFLQIETSVTAGISPVKCCAPTGTAAKHICGQTIHSLLNIPVDKYLNYASLSALQLQTLRIKFVGVHNIIIDEINMVSDRMLTYISRRLAEVNGNSLPFGGFSMIFFGDFFFK